MRLPTVLVAEPHGPTREFVAEQLRQAGLRVLAASEPGPAFELFAEERPDLVVLAVDLPRVGNAHVGRKIREAEGGTTVPLVAVDKAHLGRTLGIASVLELRADAYLPDPTRPGLREKVEELLARSGGEGDGVGTVLARPPVVAGSVEGHALLAAWVGWHRVGRDGILVLQQRDRERRVYVLAGQPVGFDSSSRADSLFRWLVERGTITQAQGDEALEATARDGLSPGASLVATGALEPEAMAAELRAYVKDRVARVLGAREGRYRFHAGREHAGQVPAAGVPALACVLEATRHVLPTRVAARALKAHLASFPRRTEAFSSDLAELGLERDELLLAMQISGRVRLSDLLGSGRGELRQRYGLLLALTLAGDLEHAPEPSTAEAAYGEDKLAPRKKKPLPPELAEEIREGALGILTGSYFRVLGLSIGATTDDVERAYHDAATRFQPDRFAEHEVGELADLLAGLQERIGAAYRVLATDEKRAAYVAHLLGRLEPRSRRHGVVAAAEVQIKRGEALLGKGDAKAAAALFARAIELNAREPEYFAYLAWAQFRGAVVGSVADRAREARKTVKRALSLEPENDRLAAILGILEAEAGDASEGRRILLKALRRNERNELAKAALRRLNRL